MQKNWSKLLLDRVEEMAILRVLHPELILCLHNEGSFHVCTFVSFDELHFLDAVSTGEDGQSKFDIVRFNIALTQLIVPVLCVGLRVDDPV